MVVVGRQTVGLPLVSGRTATSLESERGELGERLPKGRQASPRILEAFCQPYPEAPGLGAPLWLAT